MSQEACHCEECNKKEYKKLLEEMETNIIFLKRRLGEEVFREVEEKVISQINMNKKSLHLLPLEAFLIPESLQRPIALFFYQKKEVVALEKKEEKKELKRSAKNQEKTEERIGKAPTAGGVVFHSSNDSESGESEEVMEFS